MKIKSKNNIEPSSRWVILAAARFVLSCVVMVGHMGLFGATGHSWTRFGLFLNQGSAVYGFLVISGYSIGGSLERSEKGFYIRRFWRIFPTYFTSIFLSVVAGYLIPGEIVTPTGMHIYSPNVVDIFVYLFFLQSFIGTTDSVYGVLWTIGVEWWEYVLAPLFKKCATTFLLILIVASIGVYIRWTPPANPAMASHGQMFLNLSWYWLIGFLYHRHRRTPWGYVFLFLPIMAVMGEAWVGRAALIGVAAVALCDEIEAPKNMALTLEWLGELSYPIYAIHVPMIVLCMYLNLMSPIIAVCATALLSVFVLHTIDLPMRRWGVKFFDGLRGRIDTKRAESTLWDR